MAAILLKPYVHCFTVTSLVAFRDSLPLISLDEVCSGVFLMTTSNLSLKNYPKSSCSGFPINLVSYDFYVPLFPVESKTRAAVYQECRNLLVCQS